MRFKHILVCFQFNVYTADTIFRLHVIQETVKSNFKYKELIRKQITRLMLMLLLLYTTIAII